MQLRAAFDIVLPGFGNVNPVLVRLALADSDLNAKVDLETGGCVHGGWVLSPNTRRETSDRTYVAAVRDGPTYLLDRKSGRAIAVCNVR